jgi:hypothetical protein
MDTRSATRIGTAAGLIWVAALVAGCGGDDGSGAAASCGEVAPCGGSLLGTWTVSSACDIPNDLTAGVDCPAAAIDRSPVRAKATGSLTFYSDMTFAISISRVRTLHFTVSLDCVPTLRGCDQVASSFTTEPPPVVTTTCTTMNALCVCTMAYADTPTATRNGSYTTAGTVLTTRDYSGYTADDNYCVQGNTLHLVGVDTTTGAITDDLVATR